MKVIVTGAAGFIGSNIAKALEKDYEVIAIDDFSSGVSLNLEGFNGKIIKKDIRDIDWERLFSKEGINAICHQAAITDTRVTDKKIMMSVNVDASRKIMDFCVKHDIRLVYASSAAVYGQGKSPMKEDQELAPLNIYGISKMEMDRLASDYIKKYPKARICGLRYFNVFGRGEKHKGPYASMIWQLYLQMKNKEKPRIFKDGNQTRDHVYVKDVVFANQLMLSNDSSGIFNVGTGKETSFNEIIKCLNSALKTDLETQFIENPYNFFQKKTCADISKIKKMGYVPKFNVEEGINDYFYGE